MSITSWGTRDSPRDRHTEKILDCVSFMSHTGYEAMDGVLQMPWLKHTQLMLPLIVWLWLQVQLMICLMI